MVVKILSFAVYRPLSDPIENFNESVKIMLHSDGLKGKSCNSASWWYKCEYVQV